MKRKNSEQTIMVKQRIDSARAITIQAFDSLLNRPEEVWVMWSVGWIVLDVMATATAIIYLLVKGGW